MKKLFIMISMFVVMLMCSLQASAISGEGTEANPFLIETEEDFMVIGDFPAMYYKLNSDITVNSVLGDFSGTLDGNGFSVTTTKDYIFLSNSGTLKNMNVCGGMLVCTNNTDGLIDSCVVDGVLLTEKNYGDIKKCNSLNYYIVDKNYGNVSDCRTINYYMVYENSGTVSNCYTTGEVENLKCGLVYRNKAAIENSHSDIKFILTTGEVSTALGYQCKCSTAGLVSDNGYPDAKIEKCSFTGKFDVDLDVFTSDFDDVSVMLNGIASSSFSTSYISECYSKCSADVVIKTVKIEEGEELSMITFSPICMNALNINDCYSICDFNGKVAVRGASYNVDTYYGISATSAANISNSYAVSKTGTLDGLSPTENDGIINSYYLSDSPSTDDTTCGIPKSSGAMKMKLCYTDWDFDTIWAIDPEINDGYPYLQWQYENAEEPVVLDYTINSLTVTDGNDNVLDSIPETGSCYAEISITKNTDRNEKDYLIIASYDENGTLIDFTYMRGLYNQNQDITFGSLLKNQGIKTIKAFVWDGISSMTPLSNSCIFE